MEFVDTNVLLYVVSHDPREQAKRVIATRLLDRLDLALSVQVLQEFYVQATRPRPRRPSLTHEQACGMIESFLRMPVQAMTTGVMRTALALRERYGVSYWDAAILAAAQSLGCSTVLSEDLSHGQTYGKVTVVNPFR